MRRGRASRYSHIISDFCCQSYGIRPIEGGHLPWGISVEKVVYEFDPMARPPSREPMQELNFIADSVSEHYARLTNAPIIAETNTNSKFSLDQHHVLFPLMENEDTCKFSYLDKILAGYKLEEFVPPSRPDVTSANLPMQSEILEKSSAFFDDVTSHVVHDFRFPKWNAATSGEERLTTDLDSFLTAEDTF